MPFQPTFRRQKIFGALPHAPLKYATDEDCCSPEGTVAIFFTWWSSSTRWTLFPICRSCVGRHPCNVSMTTWNKAFTDIRLRPGIATHRPLRPNVTSSINRKYITYRNAATGGPSHGHRDLHNNFREDRSSGSRDMLADRQTDTQTDLSQYSAPASPGRSNYCKQDSNNWVFITRKFTTLDLAQMETLVHKIQGYRLQWFGHVEQMDNSRLPAKALATLVLGTRSQGRQRKRWLDNVKDYPYRTGSNVYHMRKRQKEMDEVCPCIRSSATHRWRRTSQRSEGVQNNGTNSSSA